METRRKPPWLKVNLSSGNEFSLTRAATESLGVPTVCRSAKCPNLGDCWARKSAAFMILGENCTRACRFCAVPHGRPCAPDPGEPARTAEAAAMLGLKYVTLTSVTRDDLPDGGAGHWAQTVLELRRRLPGAKIEILVPDFRGRIRDIDTVAASRPDVFNHNLETVRRLQKPVRGAADYDTSLSVLSRAALAGIETKSGIMLGLGETVDEVRECILDIRAAGASMLTVGQYIPPSPRHATLERWAEPSEFECIRKFALSAGFRSVLSAPLARSSYHPPSEDPGCAPPDGEPRSGDSQ